MEILVQLILSVHILALRRPSSPTSLYASTRASTVGKDGGISGSGNNSGIGGGEGLLPKMLPTHIRHHSIPASHALNTLPSTNASGYPSTSNSTPSATDNHTNPALATARKTIIGRLAAACNQSGQNVHNIGNDSTASLQLNQKPFNKLGSLLSMHECSTKGILPNPRTIPTFSSLSNTSLVTTTFDPISVQTLTYTPAYVSYGPYSSSSSETHLKHRARQFQQTCQATINSVITNSITSGINTASQRNNSSHYHFHHPYHINNHNHYNHHHSSIVRSSFSHSVPHFATRLSCKF